MNPKCHFLLTLALAAPVTLPAVDAIQAVQGFNQVGFITAEAGFSFAPTTNLTVTALGYHFGPSTNSASYRVRLLNAGGGEVVAATINAGPASTNQILYTNIGPVALEGGSTNFLVASDAAYFIATGTNLWVGGLIDSRDPDTGSFAVAPQVQYLNAVSGTNQFAGTNAPFYLLVGPNFQFADPAAVVPSTLSISLLSSNMVRLSWPATDTTGVLQSAPAVTGVWTNVPTAPTNDGPSQVVELPVVPPHAFFRLAY